MKKKRLANIVMVLLIVVIAVTAAATGIAVSADPTTAIAMANADPTIVGKEATANVNAEENQIP